MAGDAAVVVSEHGWHAADTQDCLLTLCWPCQTWYNLYWLTAVSHQMHYTVDLQVPNKVNHVWLHAPFHMHPQLDVLHVHGHWCCLRCCYSSMREDYSIPGASTLSLARSADAALQDCVLKAASTPLQLWHNSNTKRRVFTKQLVEMSAVAQHASQITHQFECCSPAANPSCCLSSQGVALAAKLLP